MPAQDRVFISAASAEFGALREEVAAMLHRSGIDVEYQEIFPQTATDTVRKLGDLVRRCPLLVHIVGHQPGSVAVPAAVADFFAAVPQEQFLARFPDIRAQLGDFSGITYTQWEAYLALHFGIPVFLYAPMDACEPGARRFRDSFVQKAHIDRLLLAGRHPECCEDEAEFIGKILADVYNHLGVPFDREKPRNLPYPTLGSLFKGRDSFLADIRAQLRSSGTTVIKGRQAIHGMGGVGKTRAAVEYAWAHASEYRALLFVTADSPDSLERNLAALCGPLVLNLPEQEARETEVKVAAVLRWLAQNPGWFLIIDNADTPEAQRAVAALLAQLPEGHIVITSRLADWPAGVTALELDVLDAESSIAFLLERTADRRIPHDDDRATAARIAAMLDCLALALEQCAAYIRHRRCDLAGYLADWEGRRAHVIAWFDADKSLYPRSLAVTYDTSVAQLTENARELFRILSCIAPDPMPLWAVEKIASLPEPRALLNEIADLHLARFTADREACTVHRMLQEITRQQQKEEKPEALIAALGWVNREMPTETDDVRTWPIAVPLTPHAVATATFAADHHTAEPTARLLNQAVLLLMKQADYRAAEPLMRLALTIDNVSFGESHPNVAIRLNNLAVLLRNTNRLAEAEPLLRSALASGERYYGKNHPQVARILNNLAELLQATNRFAEAEPLIRRAVAIDQVCFDGNHPEVASRLVTLAALLKAANRLVEAESLMRRALAIFEKSLGETHPNVAAILNNLAQLLQATNRLAEAEPLMRRAVNIIEKSLGTEHSNSITARRNLEALLAEMGK